MADIIGEKHLYSVGNSLCRQLSAEENYYTAISLIEAIGRIGYEVGLKTINEWLEMHERDIVTSRMYTVFRHAQNAITRLDSSADGALRGKFAEKYAKYITEDVPL